ncbi:hypothetical protein BKA67DRAFT_588952 [Truncatella angustata]|uniref:Uncharacterized protein n=1 Tax=Truncatella angustata TaxID=152316 RepID=A0A9P8RJH8_9PEZI|nr:uncharacterized protein BKA67DRAFT_588952 [Truncatella angustata]KAH6638612.1 hypothetical protein BKA67DRAFT_588952 [Truncatella angustata]KAH8203063.1 hypothetical protein TruAng_002791 [Truncatella angustata]
MATYVVTGVSRGIGYGFLTFLTKDPNNTVIGIVRDKAGTLKKISEDPELKGRSNFHIVEGDLASYDSLKKAAAETASITGGSIDYLISNAGYIPLFDAFDPIDYLVSNKPKETEEELKKVLNTNVIGQIQLFSLFIPQILKGKAKKVVTLTSGLADLDFTNQFDVFTGSLYSISKAAMNMAVAKFSAQYKEDGIHFISICPGLVDTGLYKDSSEEDLAKLGVLMGKFAKYKPDFSGPVTTETSVQDVKRVWETTSIENGDGGAFLSQYGNKTWL